MTREIKRIHFMGIGGSGISGVALLAKVYGYEVSGCDISEDTAYIKPVKRQIKKFYIGDNPNHLNGIDLLVITPAILYQNKDSLELKEAGNKNIDIITWEMFLGKYLLKEKKAICIAGTHGKSTTTGLASLVFEKAGLDPSVMVGANIKEWKTNFRYGKSNYFIVEADEFNNNFLNYKPDTIILNNIEFDHPDFFKSEEEVFVSFEKFIARLHGEKNLIVNKDSPGVRKLLQGIGKRLKDLNFKSYSLKEVNNIKPRRSITGFEFNEVVYKLKIPGVHNIANALGVIILSEIYKIDKTIIQKVFSGFDGVNRRLELIGKADKVMVYDDYAHHPTAIKATLEALRQRHPKERFWAIIEPHSYSRTKALLTDYKGVFEEADRVIIAPIYKARDSHNFGVSEESVVAASKHKNIKAFKSFNHVVDVVIKDSRKDDVILVMGAGKSYLLAREILNNLKFKVLVAKRFSLITNKFLSKHTTLGIGGPARYFVEVKNEKDLLYLIKRAVKLEVRHFVIAGGSNLLVSDKGFKGLVIKNSIEGIKITGDTVTVKSGTGLQEFIDFVIDKGFSGIETMSGIPGSLGGAIFGNAGAYGQTISDCLVRVKVFNGKNITWISKKKCGFDYRESNFKRNGFIILETEFKFTKGDTKTLRRKADEIIKIRKQKYPPGIKCPGSFFKNIEANKLSNKILSKIPKDKIVFGKVPAGYLLEKVGAKGQQKGKIKIADYHGNLVINLGNGLASDFYSLAFDYALKVEKKFGIKLVPEVQLIGEFDNLL